MNLTKLDSMRAARWLATGLLGMALAGLACAQGVTTTTVQGTVYLANGQPGSGTVLISWPSFFTAGGALVAAGNTTAAIGADGFLSVNLAPNLGSSPAGLFYTAVFQMSDGSYSTQYWVVPAASQAALAAVQSQIMPSVQAVQAVNKAYVDQAIQAVTASTLAPSGGTLTGPLYLSGDPTQSLQAADKHYVDASFSQALPLTGGTLTGPVTATQIGAAIQVDQMSGADFGAKLQSCLAGISSTYGGTCDARNFSGALAMAANVTISTANTTVLLPCATINTADQILVTAGTSNVSLRGCALRGSSAASGTLGGTVFAYSGSAAMIQVGDPTYAADTQGFHLDNAVLNTTASASATAQGLRAYRTQELDLESLYFQGNSNQTALTLDGTGNYTGGTFYDDAFTGFLIAVNAIGHQVANPATTDWLNASTFVRLHIDCPTASGNPIAGATGINLAQGDGNTFTGGDVEGCSTALHLGPNAQNNTIVGLRNENSASQVIADVGSAYNNWITGGTMFSGKLTDNGTRNSFLDTFHRSFNGINGDWYGSQQDATVTNHFRLGTGAGNERGLLDRYQTDSGYRWTAGLSDAAAGEQFYQVLDELNNVYRLSIGQYNNGQSSTNNQTVLNAAGSGAVVLNGSSNSGTGGVIFGSGGPSEATVATISNTGNAQFNGTLQVAGPSTFTSSATVRNQADAEIDALLWAGLTAEQKESFIYKDHTGLSQWYMVKDASNNWALNSATGGLDSIKAYQSTNSGDTYINASNAAGVVRVNYEPGAGTAFNVYGGGSSALYASFSGTKAIKLPGLAAASGTNCLQIDNSGYITNTGAACGSASTTGTVNGGSAGQIAFYNSTGTAISGMSAVPVSAGGTGTTTSAGALANLGGLPLAGGTLTGPLIASVNEQFNVMAPPYNAKGDGVADDTAAINSAISAAGAAGVVVLPPGYAFKVSALTLQNYTKISASGAKLIPSIANQTLLTIPAGPSLQTNGKLIISGLEIDGSSQSGTTGIAAGNNAQVILDKVNIHDCAVGAALTATQFADFYSLRLYNNGVGMKVYSDPSAGGGNSINLFGGQIVGNTVGVIFATSNMGQGSNYFYNTSFLSNQVAAVAAFGVSAMAEQVYFYGATPEDNAVSTAPASTTVDGHVIQRAAFFGSAAMFNFESTFVADALANPWMILTNGSIASLYDLSGYGQPYGVLVQADATSSVKFNGYDGAIGIVDNIAKWPPSLILSTGWQGYGAALYEPSAIQNNLNGTPSSPYLFTTGVASTGTDNDPVYGVVNNVTFAASAGTSETNRAILPAFSSVPTVASDVAVSILAKSNINCSVRYGNYPTNPYGVTVPLAAGIWTRMVFTIADLAANTNVDPMLYAADASGCTVDLARMQITSGPTGMPATQSAIAQMIAIGAVGGVGLSLTGTTGSIGGSALAAGACTSGTVAVTGATTGMSVAASPVTYPGDGIAWRAYVSSSGVVTVKVCADVAATPAVSAYNVRVLQ